MLKFLKNLFCTKYFMVKVSGIFRDGIYASTPQNLYFTTIVVPLLKSDISEYFKNPADFVSKAIHEMHPEMKGFLVCELTTLGWYSSEEFFDESPGCLVEKHLKIPVFRSNQDPTGAAIPMKTATVTYRIFHGRYMLLDKDVAVYIKQYLQTTLEAYFEDINIIIGDVQVWA